MEAEEKNKLKTKYKNKYKKIYKDILSPKVEDLIDMLAINIVVTLECDEHINEEGVVTKMCQGSYSIDRENPYVKILDRSTKTCQAIIRQLDDMMPSRTEQSNAKAGETFAALVAKGRDYELH